MKRQKLQEGSPGAGDASELEPKSKKRFVGVRQRPSGRWVAEIKDTTQKIRLWLGTFDSAEEGAKAYDSGMCSRSLTLSLRWNSLSVWLTVCAPGGCDAAARALRGANTRTNFVTAIACEGAVPATTSKAARLIRLRQIAAANAKSEAKQKLGHPLLRQDLSPQSVAADASDDERHSQVTTPPRLISSSPLKPPRQIGRKHNAPSLLSSVKTEQEGTAPPPPASTGENYPELHSPTPQQSAITSENLSNAINHSILPIAPPENPNLSPLSRPPLETCNQLNTTAPSPANDEVTFSHKAVDNGSKKREAPPLENSSVSADENHLTASPPASQQSLVPCSSNKADASQYGDDNERPIFTGIDSSPATGSASCKLEVHAESSLQSCGSTGAASTSETPRAKEFGSEQDTIPWPDYVLVDGLDLPSCETNCGVYASAFDFSAEAMDRDSCTSSVLLEDQQYLSDDSTEFLLTMPPEPEPEPPLSPSPDRTTHGRAQSSGSTDTVDGDAHGECSSPQALWSCMDLAPLCMVSQHRPKCAASV